MLFRLSIVLLNLVGLIVSINTELWHYSIAAALFSMFLVRASLGFKESNSIYWFKPDVTVLMVIMIYVLPTLFDAIMGRNILFLEHATLFKYCILIVSFTFALFVATKDLNRPIVFPDEKSQYQDHRRYAIFAYILIAGGAFMYLYLIFSRFGSIANLIALQRLEFYRDVQGLGVFLAGVSFLRFGWIYLYILHLTSPKYKGKILMHAVFLAVFCLYFLIQGERGIWVKLLVGIIFVHLFFNKVKLRYVMITILVGTLALQLFSKLRLALDSPNVTMGEMMQNVNPEWLNMAGGETGSHFSISQHVLNDPELSRMRYGRTYIDGILNLIPRVLWPSRDSYVVLPHIEYMLKYFDRSFFQGGGRAYSFFLEAYINFWYLGPILMGLLVGLFLTWFFKICLLERPNALKLALFASSFGSILLIVRSTFAAIVKDFMLSSLFPFLFIWTLIMIDRLTRSKSS